MSTIQTSIENQIAIITINRPKQLNALSHQVLTDLKKAFLTVQNNDEVGIVILTGEGDKAFIAGADIKEMSKFSPDEAKEYSLLGQSVTIIIENFNKPVIAAINGFALGGGCEFAMACHIRYASEKAQLGQPEVGLGLIAGFGGTQRLPRLVSKGNAFEMLLTGKIIKAQEAKEIGLVDRIFLEDELINECIKTANKIIRNSSIALTKTIQSINEGLDLPLNKGLKQEAEHFMDIFETEDSREGMKAFLDKRRAKFLGK